MATRSTQHFSAVDRLTVPGGGEAEGSVVLVATPATGAFAGKDEEIATLLDTRWTFHEATDAAICSVLDEDAEYIYSFDQSLWASKKNIWYERETDVVGVTSASDITWETENQSNTTCWTLSGVDLTCKFTGLYEITCHVRAKHTGGNDVGLDLLPRRDTGGGYATMDWERASTGAMSANAEVGSACIQFKEQIVATHKLKFTLARSNGTTPGTVDCTEMNLQIQLLGLPPV